MKVGICFSQLRVFVLGMALVASVQAELNIEITEGADSAIPIAVVPFKNLSSQALEEDVAKVVQNDLRLSGDLAPLSMSRMMSLPSRATEVFFRDWKLLGQNYLLVGEVTYSQYDKKYEIRFELFDVNRQERILGEKISGKEGQLRDLAHFVSDKVYQAITGVRGVFRTRIAFVTQDREGKKSVYRLQVADMDGQRAKIILKTAEPILSPAWSPDGKMLAYSSFESGRPAIYTHDIYTGKRQIISNSKGLNGAPAWSPDGTALLMTLSKDGNAEIYYTKLSDRKPQKITDHWGIDTEAAWSPDGRQIAFTSDRGGRPQIYMQSLTGGTATRMTFEGNYNARPMFSPDGKYLYYVHQREGSFHVAQLDLKSRNTRVLTRTPLDESPSIAPNGRLLIYATQQGKNSALAVVSIDSDSKYNLPSAYGDVREPSWSPFPK